MPRKTKPKVVNMATDARTVRIDRRTPWGNPFVLGRDGDRDEVIAKHTAYLDERIASGEVTDADLLSLAGQTLGCWCKPEACHGDVLADRVRAAVKRDREQRKAKRPRRARRPAPKAAAETPA